MIPKATFLFLTSNANADKLFPSDITIPIDEVAFWMRNYTIRFEISKTYILK